MDGMLYCIKLYTIVWCPIWSETMLPVWSTWVTIQIFHEERQGMTVRDARDILGARVLVGEEYLDREVKSACGSDMMSDVLAFSKDHSILLTGLCNPQVIRTAEMLDIVCLIFVRGKKPDEAMLEMAKDRGLVVMATGHRMFSACGMLYEAGMHGGAI